MRDISAQMLQLTSKDVSIEPVLNPTHTTRRKNAAEQDSDEKEEAGLDISCVGLWRRLQRTFFDVRITHLNNKTNLNKTTEQVLKIHENAKRNEYGEII